MTVYNVYSELVQMGTALVLAALFGLSRLLVHHSSFSARFACIVVNQTNIPALNATLTGLGELLWWPVCEK
jgi:hypothetical protein